VDWIGFTVLQLTQNQCQAEIRLKRSSVLRRHR
jgi:hypothetical protein